MVSGSSHRLESILTAVVIAVIKAPANVCAWLAGMFWTIFLERRTLAGSRHRPGDDRPGAGVTARLKPRPPILSGAIALALPRPGEDGKE